MNRERSGKRTGTHLSHTLASPPLGGTISLPSKTTSPPPAATRGAELMMDEVFDTEKLDMLLRVPTKDFPNKPAHAHPGPY